MEKYRYSIAVDEALERYGAKTHGSLAQRVERLKRFTELTNKRYQQEIEQEQRLFNAIKNGFVKTKRG